MVGGKLVGYLKGAWEIQLGTTENKSSYWSGWDLTSGPINYMASAPTAWPHCLCHPSYGWRSGWRLQVWVVQSWEHSPPTNVTPVQIPASTSYVGSLPAPRGFFWVLRFSLLLKNQHFQIPVWSGMHRRLSTSSYDLLSAPWVNKLQLTILQYLLYNKLYSFKNKSSWDNCYTCTCKSHFLIEYLKTAINII